MDNTLLIILASKTKETWIKFLKIELSGSLLSLLFILLIDLAHPNFCPDFSNIYFWKCNLSLWVHLTFIILFPLFFAIFGIIYSQKYLLYLIVEVIVQKAKYKSLEWITSNLPSRLESVLKKISLIIQSKENHISNPIQKLVDMPFEKITEKFLPSLFVFYLLIFMELVVFVIIWERL